MLIKHPFWPRGISESPLARRGHRSRPSPSSFTRFGPLHAFATHRSHSPRQYASCAARAKTDEVREANGRHLVSWSGSSSLVRAAHLVRIPFGTPIALGPRQLVHATHSPRQRLRARWHFFFVCLLAASPTSMRGVAAVALVASSPWSSVGAETNFWPAHHWAFRPQRPLLLHIFSGHVMNFALFWSRTSSSVLVPQRASVSPLLSRWVFSESDLDERGGGGDA